MHLVESYSTISRLKIGKMELPTHYFPLPFEDKFVVLCSSTGAPAKNYSYWKIVASLLKPVVNAEGYKLVQIGDEKDEKVESDLDLCGKTTISHFFDIVKRSALVVSGDTSIVHAAGHFNIPLVSLYSISPPEVSGAYFGDKSKQTYLRPSSRPSYNPNELPKTIDFIKPEDVANACLKMLGLPEADVKINHIGPLNALKAIDVIPNDVFDPRALEGYVVNIRFDKGGLEKNVYQQLSHSKCAVFTNRVLDVAVLLTLKQNIEIITYEITEENDPSFVLSLKRAGIRFQLVSRLPQEDINKFKLDYAEYGIIQKFPVNTPVAGQTFASNKKVLSKGRAYLSYAHVRENKPLDNLMKTSDTIINTPAFWEDLEHYIIYA